MLLRSVFVVLIQVLKVTLVLVLEPLTVAV